MKKTAYLSIACDTDPDINPPYREARDKQNPEDIWQGIARGISALRQRLEKTSFFRKHGSLPITWLLRCDRQIYELYGDAAFCFRRFEDVWKTELKNGNEIGQTVNHFLVLIRQIVFFPFGVLRKNSQPQISQRRAREYDIDRLCERK